MPQATRARSQTTTIRVSVDLIEEARSIAMRLNPTVLPSRAIEACIREGMKELKKELRVLRSGLEGLNAEKPRKRKR